MKDFEKFLIQELKGIFTEKNNKEDFHTIIFYYYSFCAKLKSYCNLMELKL